MFLLRPAILVFTCGFLRLFGQSSVSVGELAYEPPTVYEQSVSNNFAFVDDFRCGTSGTVFFEMYDTQSADDPGLETLIGLRADGKAVAYRSSPAAGFGPFSSPIRLFITKTTVFALVRANKINPTDHAVSMEYANFIIAYDYEGRLLKTIRLSNEFDPVSFAVFSSGHILLVSTNRFSASASLSVLDSDGDKSSVLEIGDASYGLSTQSVVPKDVEKYVAKMLSLAQFVEYGDNILMIPRQSRLPILNLSERGVSGSTSLALPPNRSMDALLAGGGKGFLVTIGGSKDGSDPYAPATEGTNYFTDHEIDEFDPSDGQLINRLKYNPDLTPVCRDGDKVIFLTVRPQDRRLELVTATPSH